MWRTDPCSVEGGGQHQHDVVGPVLLVDGHLVLLDDQDVEVRGSVHGVVEVKQAVLMAARGGGEDGALDAVRILSGKRLKGQTVTHLRGIIPC